MKIAVTNYTGDRGNWGCQATSHNLLDFLHATFAPEAEGQITTVPFPKGHRIDKYIEAVFGARIRKILSAHDPSAEDLEFLLDITRERFGSFVDVVQSSDLVVFQGEGTIAASGSYRSVRVFALPFLAKHLWKKPVFSMNQTLYSASPDDTDVMVNIFKDFDVVAVREAASYLFAKKVDLENVVLCPDMAFQDVHKETGNIAESKAAQYFCVSGSAAMEQYDHAWFVGLIGRISRHFNLVPVFIFSRERDAAILNQYTGELEGVENEVFFSANYPNVDSIIPLLAKAKFVIGGRYHTSITALSQTTPVILLPGNTYKSEGIGPMLGIDCLVYGQGQDDEIINRVDYLLNNEEPVRSEIDQAMNAAKDLFDHMSAYLQATYNLIKGGG